MSASGAAREWRCVHRRSAPTRALRQGERPYDHLVLTVADIEATCAFYWRPAGVAIEEGPVTRTGTLGPIRSVYLRDPDGNLLEIAVAEDPA